MFFGVVQQHYGEYQRGLYFEKYPDLTIKESGLPFRYREQQKTAQMEDLVANLAHDMIQKVIISTTEIPWKSEAYILLGDELWRIISTTHVPMNPQALSVVKKSQREYTVTVRKVSNAVGMSL